jgi:hypothetical protein
MKNLQEKRGKFPALKMTLISIGAKNDFFSCFPQKVETHFFLTLYPVAKFYVSYAKFISPRGRGKSAWN